MFSLFRMDDDFDKCVFYLTNSLLERKIKFFLRKNKLDDILFENILFELGFDPERLLFLKKDYSSDSLSIYYSYEKGQFDEEHKIILNCYGSVMLISDGTIKKYLIKRDKDNAHKVCLKNNIIRINKNINGIIYKCDIDNGIFSIYVKRSDGSIITFKCKKQYNRDYNNAIQINESELEHYAINIREIDSVHDVVKKLCELSMIDEVNYEEIEFDFSENGVEKVNYLIQTLSLSQIKVTVCEEGKQTLVYERDKNFGNKKINISVLNFPFKLCLEVIDNDFVVGVSNEFELRKYLMNLKFPIRIDELYKKICQISLGDGNKYPLIDLKFSHYDLVIDSIVLENGELKFFKMTKDGKISIIDKDGVFSYVKQDDVSSMSLDINEDTVTRCEYSSFNGILVNDNLIKEIHGVVDEAKAAKVRTRKFLDEILRGSK